MIGSLSQQSDVVLVVDDSPDTVRLLTDVLDGAGMSVMVALDGQAALKIASRLTPDVVLMDAVMPGMDGFETCRQMKRLSGFEDVPVIFMTGLSEPEDTLRGFAAGGVDYVTKPMDIDSVLARITVHLSNARKLRSARTALDAADQFLVATDRSGKVVWFTPQAYRMLEERIGCEAADSAKLQLPSSLVAWLRKSAAQSVSMTNRVFETIYAHDGLHSRISFVGEAEPGEILFRISDAAPQDKLANIRAKYSLTQRETEVLSWIAQGKSNRDIASILALSPRTIDKHLEVIFGKLAVENRTAAVALIHSSRI